MRTRLLTWVLVGKCRGRHLQRKLGELAGAICENKIVNMGFGRKIQGSAFAWTLCEIVRYICENKIVIMVLTVRVAIGFCMGSGPVDPTYR